MLPVEKVLDSSENVSPFQEGSGYLHSHQTNATACHVTVVESRGKKV